MGIIIKNIKYELVEFTKLSKKDHTCQENNIFISNNEIQTYNENIQFAEDLIKKIQKKQKNGTIRILLAIIGKYLRSKIKYITKIQGYKLSER